jgi:hypothetical protein
MRSVYSVFQVKGAHRSNRRLDLGKVVYCFAIDVWSIRDEVERVDGVGMNKNTPSLLETEFAQCAHDRGANIARRDGKIDVHRSIYCGNMCRDRTAADNDNLVPWVLRCAATAAATSTNDIPAKFIGAYRLRVGGGVS